MKFTFTKTIVPEHLPVPSLVEGIKELVELYAEIGPLETQLAIIEDKLDVLREVFANHAHHHKIDDGLDKLVAWIEHHLPKELPEIDGVFHEETEYEQEHRIMDDERYRDWHELKGHRISEHPSGYIKFQIEFKPGTFPSKDEFSKYVEHKIEPWFAKNGMKHVDIDEDHAENDHTLFIGTVHINLFRLDVEVRL